MIFESVEYHMYHRVGWIWARFIHSAWNARIHMWYPKILHHLWLKQQHHNGLFFCYPQLCSRYYFWVYFRLEVIIIGRIIISYFNPLQIVVCSNQNRESINHKCYAPNGTLVPSTLFRPYCWRAATTTTKLKTRAMSE